MTIEYLKRGKSESERSQDDAQTRAVVEATLMLESMTENSCPTRAEATDVANAILDGTDCVMLSGEAARVKDPMHAVNLLARIAVAIEPGSSGSK